METWLPVPGHEGAYEVSDLGRVRSLPRKVTRLTRLRSGIMAEVTCFKRGVLLRPGIASTGYPTVALCGRTRTVHSLVAHAFLGQRREGMQVRHLDGDRKNSRLSNLKYGTPSENQADAVKHGTRVRGEGYRSSKLTESSARFIRDNKGLIPQSRLASMFGVSPAAVQAVHDGRTWTHV